MGDVMDEADRASAHEEFDRGLALRLHEERFGRPEARNRVILTHCEECGGEIEPRRREANTVGDIRLCIDCQLALEALENRHGWGMGYQDTGA